MTVCVDSSVGGYSIMTLWFYFNISVTGPLRCGCHSPSEGGLFLYLFYFVTRCGNWPEEQWDAIKREPTQAVSLSLPLLFLSHPQSCLVLLCAVLGLQIMTKSKCVCMCVRRCVCVRWCGLVGRRSSFFSRQVFTLLMKRKTGENPAFHFFSQFSRYWYLAGFVFLAALPLMILIPQFIYFYLYRKKKYSNGMS